MTPAEAPTQTPETATAKETKRQAFVRLVTKRVGNAVDKIRLIGNCSSRATYEYTPEDIAKIRSVLMDECNKVLTRFAATAKAAPEEDVIAFD